MVENKVDEIPVKNLVEIPEGTAIRDLIPVELNKLPVHKHIFIFDWDDTLFPTTFLDLSGYTPFREQAVDEETAEILKVMENNILKLLDRSLQVGPVYIVTNSEAGWVQLGIARFFPSVMPYLSRVTVVSARSLYERDYPEQPFQWKYNAIFHCVYGYLITEGNWHLVSIGDSMLEREAILSIKKQFEKILTKSVKFVERPQINHLNSQIEIVLERFSYICSHHENLDLMLTINEIFVE